MNSVSYSDTHEAGFSNRQVPKQGAPPSSWISRRLLKRIICALLVGIGAAALCALRLYPVPTDGPPLPFAWVFALIRMPQEPLLNDYVPLGGDFTWLHRGAQILLAGRNLWIEIVPTGPYPFDAPLFYPMPAVLLGLPVVGLSPKPAAVLMFGVVSAVLAIALSKRGYGRFWLFLSSPVYVSACIAQVGPIVVMIAFLVPTLGGLHAVKPNAGIALFLSRPSWRAVASGVVALGATLLILPTWPRDWYRAVGQHHHVIPLQFIGIGSILLGLAAFRLAEQRGRLLFGFATVPQLMGFYDELPLTLVPNPGRQTALYTGVSWIAYFICSHFFRTSGQDWGMWHGEMVTYGLFYPALAIVLLPDIRALFKKTIRIRGKCIIKKSGQRSDYSCTRTDNCV